MREGERGEMRIRLPLERLIPANVAYIPKERTVKQIYHPGRTVWYGKGGEVKYIVTEEGKYIFPEEKESPTPTEPLDLKGTKVVKEEKAEEDLLKSLGEFYKSHPELPKIDILFEKEKEISKIEGGGSTLPSEEEIESWEGSAQQSFWWETTPTVSEPRVEEPKPEDPYSIMARKFIQRTPEGEVKHPEGEIYKTPGLDTVPSIVEESYQKLVEEKTAPEFTFETMPKVLSSGAVHYKPDEYYYWYLLTKRQFEKRGIPYTEEELKKLAWEKYQTYMKYKEFEEVIGSYGDLEKVLGARWQQFRAVKDEFLKTIGEAQLRIEKAMGELDLSPEEVEFLKYLEKKYGTLRNLNVMTPEEKEKLRKIVWETLEKQGVDVTPEILQLNLPTVLSAYRRLLKYQEFLKKRYEEGMERFEHLEKLLREYSEKVANFDEWVKEFGDLGKLREEVEKFLFSPPIITITRGELYRLSMEKLLDIEKVIMETAHPQEVPGLLASLHAELGYELEKYFPTPDISEDTLAGKGIAWTKGLPPIIREVAQFGVGIFGPLEEYRELGNYLGIPQPNVPTMLGGMVSGMFGSTEEIRMVEKYPAYAVGTLVGEVVWDYLLGKAAAKGVQKFFNWIEAKVPKTPEGKWITVHYPPLTRRVLKGLEKLKKFLIHEKTIAKTIEEVRDLGLYKFDLEEGIEGISKSFIKIGKKEVDDILDVRLLKSGDIVGGELREARKFIPEVGEPSFALRYVPKYERIDLGDIAEFARRMEDIGAEEGIMFKLVEEEGVRVPQIFDIRVGEGGLEVTRYTPTVTFEKFPVKFIEEGTEEIFGKFKPEYIKIKPEDVEDFLRPPKGSDFDEWLRYYEKKLELGKQKYGLKPPEGVDLRPPKVEDTIFRPGRGGGGGAGGLTAVGAGQQGVLSLIKRISGEVPQVDITDLVLGARRVSKAVTIPVVKIPSITIPSSKGLVSEVEVEVPRVKISEKPVLDLEVKDLSKFLLPVKIRYEPILSIRPMRKAVGKFVKMPSIATPSPKLFTSTLTGLKVGTSELVMPKVLEREISQLLSPPATSTVETKTTPPLIPPIRFLGGGGIGGSKYFGRWRKWISKWFDINIGSILLPRPRRSKKRSKKGRKRKKRGRRKK